MHIKEYDVVKETNTHDFIKSINYKIKQGWQPLSDGFKVIRNDGQLQYIQAVVVYG